MPFLEDIGDYLRHLRVYMLGKGALSLVVFGAAALGAATGLGVLLPALVVGIGGTALTAFNRLYKQGIYEQQMVDLYRDDIAAKLGIAPQDVTREHLAAAAEDNLVIGQALQRQKNKTILAIGTAALAGLVSCGLIGIFDLGGTLHGLAEASFSGMLKPLAQLVGIGTVSGITSLVLHDGLDAAIGQRAGLHKAAAHDLIIAMDSDIRHGRPITREQVYGVLVAGDNGLQRLIADKTHKPYHRLNYAEQSRLLHEIGVAHDMDALAVEINKGEIKPGHLAYLIGDTHLTAPKKEYEEVQFDQHLDKFVDRLKLAPRELMSHVERLNAKHAASSAERAV